jgi:ATP synthase protein I
MLRVQNRQIRTAIRLQAVATIAVALAIGAWAGMHGGGSALLGGLVSILAGAVYGAMLPNGKHVSAGDALVRMMRAEAVKIVVIVLLLWLVFAAYQEVIGIVFIGTFILTTLIFSLALFIRSK